MKAFLSYSSQDQQFVKQVFDILGAAQAHLDSETFEKAIFNIQAINGALSQTQVFVQFVSRDSISSDFVTYETISALERMARGQLSRILLICIDDVKIDQIDQNLHNLNIVTQVSSIGSCARRIQAALLEASLDSRSSAEVFVGRASELKSLKSAISKPTTESPIVVALSGIDGIGRRTLARKVMQEILPAFSTMVTIQVDSNQGSDDLFRSIMRLRGRASRLQATHELVRFSELTDSEKITSLCEEIRSLLSERETLIIVDGGGLMGDDGRYQRYIQDVVHALSNYPRLVAFFIQRRMPPFAVRKELSYVHFERIAPFDKEDTTQLIGAKLKAKAIRFSTEDVENLSSVIVGHPINLDFAIDSILSQNSDVGLFLKDTKDLVVWRNRRALDFVNSIDFTDAEVKICSYLLMFGHLTSDIIAEIFPEEMDIAASSLRRLLDYHIVESEMNYYTIAQPIVDAVRRSGLFEVTRAEERRAAVRLLEFIEQYKDTDDIPRALLEPAVIASLRSGGGEQSQWRQLVLPSHFLTIAREAYDRRDFPSTMQFCRDALSHASRMSDDAKVECYRMIGLSAIRTMKKDTLVEATSALSRITTRYARQVDFFLKGFSNRYRGFFVEAEAEYLKCFDINEKNFAVCRELAQVYISLGRPDEAESYARTAFEQAPNNPFVLDILVGSILGRARLEGSDLDDNYELRYLFGELEKYGHAEGKSFFANRKAEYFLIKGDSTEARKWANIAVDMAEWLIPPYLTRASALLLKGNERGAQRDIDTVTRLSRENTSYGNLFKVELFEIELAMMLMKGRYRVARNTMDRLSENRIPGTLFLKLEKQIAMAIRYDTNFHDAEMIEWAKRKLA